MKVVYVILCLPLLIKCQGYNSGNTFSTTTTTRSPCTLGNWGEWGSCSVTCGKGRQYQLRENKGNCYGYSTKKRKRCTSQPCTTDTDTYYYNPDRTTTTTTTTTTMSPCSWSDWGRWSPCSATCGEGRQKRSRRRQGRCNNPWERIEQKQTCSIKPCPMTPTTSPSCRWGQWGKWSLCSVTCGEGTQERSREKEGNCYGYNNIEYKEKNCRMPSCPLCTWGEWGGWSSCSVTCEEGWQYRSRKEEGSCYGNDGVQEDKKLCNMGSCACPHIRVRKNVKDLSTQEIRKLKNTMTKALASKKYQDVAHFHGGPNTGADALCPQTGICCPHGVNSQFLPWHRLLLANMEELLGEPLPYWDWTLDSNVPQIFESFKVPFKNFLSNSVECLDRDRTMHSRGTNISIEAGKLKNKVKTIFDLANTYEDFSNKIQDPHNDLHNSMKCDFRNPLTTAYDPIFYLHHANVDRQFAFWQELQKINGTPTVISGLQTALEPFDRKINTYNRTRLLSSGNDTLDYKTNLCYQYDSLTFDGMTPSMYAFNINSQPVTSTTTSFTSTISRGNTGITTTTTSSTTTTSRSVVIQEAPQPVFTVPPPQPELEQFLPPPRPPLLTPPRYFVGVILPKTGPSSIVEFDVCSSGGQCQKGGSVATFGFGDRDTNQAVNSNNFYISEVEVTDDVDIVDWSQAFAKVTSSPNVSPVSPIIIRREFGDSFQEGTVILAPGTNRRMYGDLLNNFQIA